MSCQTTHNTRAFRENTDYKVNPVTGCWIWIQDLNEDGYGLYRGVDGRLHFAHRQSYINANGQVPSGMQVHHKCWNPRCMNPEHLALEPHHRNGGAIDASACGIHSMDQAKEIRAAKAANPDATGPQIAEQFGVSAGAVYNVLRNITFIDTEYKGVPGAKRTRLTKRKRMAIAESRKLFAEGMQVWDIADKLRVTMTTIRRWNHPRYSDLDGPVT